VKAGRVTVMEMRLEPSIPNMMKCCGEYRERLDASGRFGACSGDLACTFFSPRDSLYHYPLDIISAISFRPDRALPSPKPLFWYFCGQDREHTVRWVAPKPAALSEMDGGIDL